MICIPMKASLAPLVLLLLSCLANHTPMDFQQAEAARQETSHPIPAWFKQHIAESVRGTGTWITDNSEYQSPQERAEAYGLRWQTGLGGLSLKGDLYGIQAAQAGQVYWEFRSYWDPLEGKAMVHQYGADGTLGVGSLAQLKNGQEELLQVFVRPGSAPRKSRHLSWFEGEQKLTQSFRWEHDAWVPERIYAWDRKQ